MNEKELLNYILTKQFNRTDEELAELLYEKSDDGAVSLKENAGDLILDLNAQKIQAIKGQTQEFFDNGYSKGKAEEAKRREKAIREKFGVQADDWDGLLDAVSALKKSKDVSVDDIKKHPAYVELETQSIPKSKYEELASEYDGFKKNIQRTMTIGKVKDLAWNNTVKLNPVESENPKIAQTVREDYLSKFDPYDYEFQGDTILIVKDGKRLEDAHGNLVKFDDFVKDLSGRYYEFRKQDDRGNAGNSGGSGGGGVPATKEEYIKAMASAKTAEDRVALMNAWENAQRQ